MIRSPHARLFRLAASAAACMALAACGLLPTAPASGVQAGFQVSGEASQQQAPAATDLAARVMVVFHEGVEESREVAEYYRQRRGIPSGNLCGIAFPSEVSLRADHYAEQVKRPLRDCLQRIGARQVLYIVFSYRTPYRVMLPNQRFDASVDSFAADVWDEVNRSPLPIREGPVNPYLADHRSQENRFAAFESFAAFRERPGTPRIYAVWRLDASSAALAKGLVDKAIRAEQAGGPQGKGCFDRNTPSIRNTEDSSYGAGEWAIQRAADLSAAAGYEVVLDTNKQEFGEAPAPLRCEPAALYAGWYSLNNYNDAFTWSEGAIGLHLDSMSAWNLRTGKSWVVNAVDRGITITGGAVSEPLLPNLTQPDGMLHDLFTGANAGDAFLRNTRLLKWRVVNVGDPLYRPFPVGRTSLTEGRRMAPSVSFRGPAALGGMPVVAVVRAGGDPAARRVVKLSARPANLATMPSELQFSPGREEQEVRISTKGVNQVSPLRIVAESEGGIAAGTVQVVPLILSLSPAAQTVRGGDPVELQVKLAATVQAGSASLALKTTCPQAISLPEAASVAAGQDLLRIQAATRPVQKETSCGITVEKFGAEREAKVVLLPPD